MTIIFNDLINQPDEKIEETAAAKCSATNSEFLPPDLQKLNNHHHEHEMKELHEKIDVIKAENNLEVHDECHRSTISYPKPNGDGYIHIASHHHHHHHRAHRGPSAAFMVLMGDIVHNLFDGLAIGVAFAGMGISGGKQPSKIFYQFFVSFLFGLGISTSIAVLCHELPHELGDFTIIIRSGMPLRNAVYWNIVASITCWFGMCIGIFLGSIKDAWLSALVGGTFLYISLVDMVPELDSCPHLPSKSRAVKLTVQMIGIAIGIAIMLLISLYENEFHLILANNDDHHHHHVHHPHNQPFNVHQSSSIDLVHEHDHHLHHHQPTN